MNKQSFWSEGIDVFHGLRLVPDSIRFEVRKEHCDAVVTFTDGLVVPCSITTKLSREEMGCLTYGVLSRRVIRLVSGHTGHHVESIGFFGRFLESIQHHDTYDHAVKLYGERRWTKLPPKNDELTSALGNDRSACCI